MIDDKENEFKEFKEFEEFDDFDEPLILKSKGKNIFKDIIEGSILTKDAFVSQIPFILFLGVLGLLYISNSYNAEKLVRKTKKLEQEIRNLQPEAIATSSELMKQSNQSEVARLVKSKNLNIVESREPPIKIVVKKDDVK